MFKVIKWFFSPSSKLIAVDGSTVYEKIVELEKRIKYLEQENIETTNVLYEMMNALDMTKDALYNMKNRLENNHGG